MHVSILILEPAKAQFGELRQEFRAAAPADWDVRLISSVEELMTAVADRAEHHLVIVPAGRPGDLGRGDRFSRPRRAAGTADCHLAG